MAWTAQRSGSAQLVGASTARPVQASAWLIAGLLASLVAQLSIVGHHLLVVHVPCAEHGELMHADGADASTAIGADAFERSGQSEQAKSVYRGGHAEIAHRHDHCQALLERRATACSQQIQMPLSYGAVRVQRLAALQAHAAIAHLALAPKASPPA